MKIAVASPPYPGTLAEGVGCVEKYIREAASGGADIICFPESYLPGYPIEGEARETPSQDQLEVALNNVQDMAAALSIAVILPMDWHMNGGFYNVAQVIAKDGTVLGIQTKNQLDPSEDNIWQAGTERQLFEIDEMKFGISICHEGFRYPETVRWAARQGASIVFHPYLTGSNKTGSLLKEWGHRENPYYEKAQMVRALENTIYFATSNYGLKYPDSASAIVAPDGACLVHQQYGETGIVMADIHLPSATGLLAKRFKPHLYQVAT